MPTQKTFKARVRARMSKTGEAYTAARRQLLTRAPAANRDEAVAPAPAAPAPPPPVPAPAASAVVAERSSPVVNTNLVSDDAVRRATGESHDHWFALLDNWGATDHTHTEIARWLRDAQHVDGWWAQGITVSYERARGMRQPGQMADGFRVGATRTIGVDAERLIKAFTDARTRASWLPVPMRQRPTKAAGGARFDWSDPRSRVVVLVEPKGPARATVSIQHEQLPDPESAERFKRDWKTWLGALKALLEAG